MRALLLSIVGAALATSAASAQISIVDNIPGAFIDISGTGTNLPINGDDVSGTFSATFGNSVLPAGTINIQSNGSINVPAFTTFGNAALTGTSVAGYYPFWDDMRSDNTGPPVGDIFAQNMADRTIVQWNNVIHFGDALTSTQTVTFQVQIFNGSSGPLAQFIYQDSVFGGTQSANDNGASATIGAVQDGASPRTFAQWSFNTASIQSGTVLSIVPAPGAVALLGLGGLLAARRRR